MDPDLNDAPMPSSPDDYLPRHGPSHVEKMTTNKPNCLSRYAIIPGCGSGPHRTLDMIDDQSQVRIIAQRIERS